MTTQSNNNIFATFGCIILLISMFISMETSDAARLLRHEEEHLLLPSFQWRPVRPPRSNPGTNSFTDVTSQVSERNFVGRKEVAHPPPPPLPSNEHSQHTQKVVGGFILYVKGLMDRATRYLY